jgi:hypothetical protein
VKASETLSGLADALEEIEHVRHGGPPVAQAVEYTHEVVLARRS